MNKLSRSLEKYRKKVEQRAKQGIAETTMLLHSEASSRIPVDTSAAKGSIELDFDKGGFKGTVFVGALYAIYLEFGTGIYATKGSRAKKIPWTYYKDGRFYTTYGMVAQPFWYPSLDLARRHFKKYFSN